MAQYAIAFDLDTTAMTQAGLTASQKVQIYQTEIPAALARCGFTAHPQGSLYHTELEQDPIAAVMQLQGTLANHAPGFCSYVRSVHVFRLDEWSDVTPIIANRAPTLAGAPEAEQELEQQEAIDANRT